MKKIILAIALFLPVAMNAQTGSTITISLQQALDMGLKNRYDIRASRYNVTIAANAVGKSQKERLPEISGSGNIRYNTQLQATYIPAGFAGLTEPSTLAFGAKNATVFGLDLNQAIFKPGIKDDIKIAHNNLDLQEEKMRAGEIDIKTRISISYFDALLRQLQYRIARNNESRFREYLDLAEGKYNNGALVENDYLHSKLDYENARVQTETARQNYNLTTDNLRYQVNIPAGTTIVLSDTLDATGNVAYQPKTNVSVDSRTEIKQLFLQQNDNKLQLDKARRNTLPTLSVFANYSQQYLYDNFNYSEGKWWTPFSYMGLKLSIPITANFRNQNNIAEYKLKAQQTDLRLKQESTDISYEIQKAATDLYNAAHNIQAAQSNYALSDTIYQNQQKQYKLGSFQYSDLLPVFRAGTPSFKIQINGRGYAALRLR